MSFKKVTTHTYVLRDGLEVEVNDGENAPQVYIAGVRHNVATVDEYVDMLIGAIKQLHEWYPDWDGWGRR